MLPADVSSLANLAPYSPRRWDVLATMMVMVLTTFWQLLPHLVQLGGAVIVALTIWEKVDARIARYRARQNQEKSDAPGR